MRNNKKAILLFSGGQDSTTILGWCLKRYDEIYLLSFDYGQNHLIEINSAYKIINKINKNFIKFKNKIKNNQVYKINNLNDISKNALTSKMKINTKEGLPNTFVPGRNLLFFTLASSYGYERNIFDIVSGICQTDYSGYPDCRKKTIDYLNKAINLGMEKKFLFHNPLMYKTKAETWELAYKIGGSSFINIIKEYTHTCYRGNRKRLNSWGYGCDNCPACSLRKKGWKEFKKNYEL